MDLQILFADFAKHGKYLRSWSPRTTAIYQVAFDLFTRFQTVSEANQTLSKASLEAWVIWLRERGHSPAGCNVNIRSLNSFLSWLHEQGHITAPLRLKPLPDPKTPIAVFTNNDLRRILLFKSKGFIQLRLHTLVCLLLDTGCRIDEALSLRTSECDLDNLLLTVTGKGSKTRKVPISTEMRKGLFRLSTERSKQGTRGDLVFASRVGTKLRYRNVHRDIGALCKRLGITGARCSPHTFRHSFALGYIRNGGDIYSLSRILGHTSLATTQLYLRSMGVEQLAEAHERFSPMARLA